MELDALNLTLQTLVMDRPVTCWVQSVSVMENRHGIALAQCQSVANGKLLRTSCFGALFSTVTMGTSWVVALLSHSRLQQALDTGRPVRCTRKRAQTHPASQELGSFHKGATSFRICVLQDDIDEVNKIAHNLKARLDYLQKLNDQALKRKVCCHL